MKRVLFAGFFLLATHQTFAFDLSVASCNVESDKDTDPAKVVQDLKQIPQSHIYGLVEVDTPDLQTYRAAIDQKFVLIARDTGFNTGRPDDRLAIVFDPDILEHLGEKEEFSDAGGSRHPLLAEFRVRTTGKEFCFVVKHLQRGREETRQAQVDRLNKWAQQKEDNVKPHAIVLVGDYNFDVTPYTKRGNRGFDLFMMGGMFRWVVPNFMPENSCPLTGSGCHPHFNSILYFAVLSGPARHWTASSEILFEDETDYCAKERLPSGGNVTRRGRPQASPSCAYVLTIDG